MSDLNQHLSKESDKALDVVTVVVARLQLIGVEYKTACRIACKATVYAFCHSAIAAGISKSDIHGMIDDFYESILLTKN